MRSLPSVLVATALITLTACSDDASGNDGGDDRSEQPSTTAPLADTVAQVELQSRSDAFGPVITATIAGPDDATSMQVGLEPTFAGVDWQPVTDSVELVAFEGYQEVFVRFRNDAGDLSEYTVAGHTVDTRAKAATASPPQPATVGLVTADSIEVVLEVGRIERGIGRVADTYIGDDVDGATLDDGWTLDGGTELTVQRRVSAPITGAKNADGDMTLFPMRHSVTLSSETALTDNTTYTLSSPLGTSIEFTVDDRALASSAVHVNQVGYGSGDAKVGYYSVSDAVQGATIAAAPTFAVVSETGEEVLSGTGVARTATDEAGKGDVTAATVFQLDFSALTAAGRYKVCVDSVGCSAPFAVDDNVWQSLGATVARSLYYNRTGLELNAPHASFARPRPNHPDDATTVYETGLTAFEASEQTDETLFDSIAEQATTTPVDNAWGGHFDAGDWDRRTQHLFMARQLIDTARRFPDAYPDGSLNLPESDNGISDLADEALWTVDLFQRLQLPDGAVRGGIESERFPDWGTASWNDTITRYAYAPDPWSAWTYASVAADAALLVAPVDAERSQRYAQSAIAAWDWAETQPVPRTDSEDNSKVLSQRGAAAAALLELTGEASYGAAFAEATPFDSGPTPVLGCHANDWCDAGWRYLDVPSELTDPTVVANIEASFVDLAQRIVDASEQTRFGWCMEDPGVPLVWGMGVGGNPHIITVLRAALISGDATFAEAAQRCAAVSFGANPTNTSFVTGRGQTPPRHPLLIDATYAGLPVWPGIPVYGTHPLSDLSWVENYRLAPAGSNVSSATLPLLESWFDLPDVAAMNEFTVYQSQGPVVWSAAALSALVAP